MTVWGTSSFTHCSDDNTISALHRMLAKGIDTRFFSLFAQHGARGDIPDPDGRTVADIMHRKKDVKFHRLAEELIGGARIR